jgi:hypothetical protein
VLDRVPQLAHVAGPAVTFQPFGRLGRDAVNADPVPLCVLVQEMGRKRRYVFWPLPQWRDLQLDGPQPVIGPPAGVAYDIVHRSTHMDTPRAGEVKRSGLQVLFIQLVDGICPIGTPLA